MCQLSEYGGTDAAATTGEPEHKKERRIRARSSAVTGHAGDLNRLKIPPTLSIEFDEQQSDIPALDSAGCALSHR